MPYKYALTGKTQDENFFRRKEVSHVLGLKNRSGEDFQNEAWLRESAVTSCCERYSEITSKSNKKTLNLTPLVSAVDGVVDPILHGTYHGFSTGWSGHFFSIHKVQENNQIHYVYYNRGDPPRDGFDKTVVVFTVPLDKAPDFERQFFDVCKRTGKKYASKDDVAAFLDHEITQPQESTYYNPILTESFSAITPQTTSNCAVANTNIAWHFQMAADYMQQYETVDFLEAYQNTENRYQRYRTQDKTKAFEGLLSSYSTYINPNNYFEDVAFILDKYYSRDRTYFAQPMIKSILENMELKYLVIIYEMINRGDFDSRILPDAKSTWVKALEETLARRINELGDIKLSNTLSRIVTKIQNFTTFGDAAKVATIEQTPWYLKFASNEMQKQIVAQNPAKFMLEASEGVQMDMIRTNPIFLQHADKDIQNIFCRSDPDYLKYAAKTIQLKYYESNAEYMPYLNPRIQAELAKTLKQTSSEVQQSHQGGATQVMTQVVNEEAVVDRVRPVFNTKAAKVEKKQMLKGTENLARSSEKSDIRSQAPQQKSVKNDALLDFVTESIERMEKNDKSYEKKGETAKLTRFKKLKEEMKNGRLENIEQKVRDAAEMHRGFSFGRDSKTLKDFHSYKQKMAMTRTSGVEKAPETLEIPHIAAPSK